MKYLTETIGAIGGILILLAYYKITHHKTTTHSKEYQLLNLIGSLCLVVNTAYTQTYSSMTLNLAWAIIAISGLIHGNKTNKKTTKMTKK